MEKASLESVQNFAYEVFVEFDRICRKYNLSYSMEGGTLLGAVKFQDFVPWDDDIDVIMRRKDYEIFLKVAFKELGKNYFLQSYNNISEFPLNYAKLCYDKSKIYNYEYSHLTKMHHGIFIDIFPIDNVKQGRFKMHCSKVGLLTGARKVKLKIDLNNVPKWKKAVYYVFAVLPIGCLNAMLTRVCVTYNKRPTDYRYEICNPNKKFPPMPSSLYDEYIELQFRDKKFLAVKDYDQLLKSRFGTDYMEVMPAVGERKPSHSQNILIEMDTTR